MMEKIKEKKPEEEKLIIPPPRTTFLIPAQVIRSNDEMLKIPDLHISTLEYENK